MALLDLTTTFGALLIGTFVSAFLYGATCLQTWHYFQSYSDPPLIKATVIILLVLETLHSAFCIHAIYYFLVTSYDNPLALLKCTWTAIGSVLVSALIIFLVHLFYAKRVYTVSRKNKIITVAIALLTLAGFGMGIVKAFRLKYFYLFGAIVALQEASISVSVATDILIASSLSYHLHHSRTGLRSTDTLINKLTIFAINNGVLTSVFGIVTLIALRVKSDNLVYFAVFQVIGNLYTNSLLATLNARRSMTSDVISMPLEFSTTSTAMQNGSSGERPAVSNNYFNSRSGKSQKLEIIIDRPSASV
ncbi:hypothetical protein BDQ12DRAFT_388149 [Crucibulum laeve]|uniref:DUF6534 domain-containing protein n=1 Tax=Crucibulum laeve TaxID=68775 RepID=A0A5C3M7U7_9AGAR|nr:hypothetical protein BDQ12DRAFT_388149 [Crucibulum laeve]